MNFVSLSQINESMKSIFISVLLFSAFQIHAQVIQMHKISSQLQRFVVESSQRSQKPIQVNVLLQSIDFDSLNAVLDSQGFSRKERAKIVLPFLYQANMKLQKQFLDEAKNKGIQVQVEESFWLCNMLSVQVSLGDMLSVSGFQDVERIEFRGEHRVASHEPMASSGSQLRSPNGTEPGLLAVKAPFLWNLGYSGKGTKILNFDSGVWPDHPTFGNRFVGKRLPIQQAWFGYDRALPGDKNSSHGTHTNGTCIGLDELNNDTIGIAYNAYFIATDPIVSNPADVRSFESLVKGYEWALNPDGDLNTFDDMPDVINNSWGRAYQPENETVVCNGFFEQVLIAVEAAGIVSIHSAGNSGPEPQTIGAPALMNSSLVNNFAVGAVSVADTNFPIAGFSSRGPSRCPNVGSISVKPEVVAPGVNVRSAVRQNSGVYDYSNFQGTSMAAPHVSGIALLLMEAFPAASAVEIKEALYYTAKDLGDFGEDNTYGRGMIDAEAAYQYLLSTYTPSLPQTFDFDLAINGINTLNYAYSCTDVFSPKLKLNTSRTISGDSLQVRYGVYPNLNNTYSLSGQFITDGDSVLLSSINLNEGWNEISFKIEYTGNSVENDTLNNYWTHRIFVPSEITNSVRYSFDDSVSLQWSNTWYINNEDQLITWENSEVATPDNDNKAILIKLADYLPRQGQKDELISNKMIVPADGKLFISFDWSYQFKTVSFRDSLLVWSSKDCGTTWNLQHSIGTLDLNTTDKVLQNRWVPSAPSDWKDTLFTLSNLNASQEVLLKIQCVNGGGSFLYLDNIQIFGSGGPLRVSKNNTENGVQIFPNPTTNTFSIISKNKQGVFSVFTTTGKEIFSGQINSNAQHEISCMKWPSGVYLINFKFSDGERATEKLVVY